MATLSLTVDVTGDGLRAVSLCGFEPGIVRTDEWDDLQWGKAFRVWVMDAVAQSDGDVPDVAGRRRALGAGVQFVPHLPFQPGVRYRATFDPEPVGVSADRLAVEFILPRDEEGAPPALTQIFPSGNEVPENVLRFYLCFSAPMRRGHAQDAIVLLDDTGAAVQDALYRAPVELWDGPMRRLTVLLDPGRLKRGVGPNRELGPPLKPDATYTLAIGAEMTDILGRQLPGPVLKRFRASEAVREPVAPEQWQVAVPVRESVEPLKLMFPHPMDEALFSSGLRVVRENWDPVAGRASLDPGETVWRFVPASPWPSGRYRVRVGPLVEDVCGNGLGGAFDRPLRPGRDLATERVERSIMFDVA